MRVHLHVIYIIYCLFKLLQAAINEKILAECFYINELKDFFFLVNTTGISLSCTDNCGCKGTNIGYQTLNCQSCCCQRRVIYRPIVVGLNNVASSANSYQIEEYTPLTPTAQKMKFSVTDFFNKCDQIRRHSDLVIFTEVIRNGKLHFLCSDLPYYLHKTLQFFEVTYIHLLTDSKLHNLTKSFTLLFGLKKG